MSAVAKRADNQEKPTVAAVPPPQEAPKAEEQKPKKRGRRLLLMIGLPLLLALGGGWFYLTSGRYQATDNAYVQQPQVQIASTVAGQIVSVSVGENATVHAGDEILRVDPEPFQIALAQADAAVAAARLQVEGLRAAYQQAVAAERSTAQNLTFEQAEFERNQTLVQRGISAQASLQEAQRNLTEAEEQHNSAVQGVASAVAALGGDPDVATDEHPAVRAASAKRDEAAYNLDHAVVHAPADGTVSQVDRLRVGQFIAAGTAIASLVETGDTWIEANFKETQLADMTAGQTAEVEVDALPGRIFRAHVESLGAGTGSEFSLIPAQNASGNWVKVVQRIPVRVVLDEGDAARLITGFSANVTVDTGPGHTTLDRLLAAF